eukprot:CAMPEP_0185726320 /NCGR_PEP_ID=MMETSP1171-20130828/2337_1 /TAXON_ID=374046 /ORGANISM="Helicotheca tamensis, Strain CCMP826" /LENGTH=127 /DNA_ID=CAMNT_0028394645 /DNA_START=34 /DNA_END=417 /DNA_ORIENTATION=-
MRQSVALSLLFCVVVATIIETTNGFTATTAPRASVSFSKNRVVTSGNSPPPAFWSSSSPPSFSNTLSLYSSNRNDDDDVNVNIIDDIDPVTITAVGFGLIAFNFFVFANMGDSGIGGLIARIINTFG